MLTFLNVDIAPLMWHMPSCQFADLKLPRETSATTGQVLHVMWVFSANNCLSFDCPRLILDGLSSRTWTLIGAKLVKTDLIREVSHASVDGLSWSEVSLLPLEICGRSTRDWYTRVLSQCIDSTVRLADAVWPDLMKHTWCVRISCHWFCLLHATSPMIAFS